MADDKVTPLFGGGKAAAPAIAGIDAPKLYDIKMKEGTLFEGLTGYLSINGLFAVLTDTPSDPMSVNFYALMEDILYIVESDEVVDATETV